MAERAKREAEQKAAGRKLSEPEKRPAGSSARKRRPARRRPRSPTKTSAANSSKAARLPNRKQRSLARFKAVAAVLIADNPQLAGRGLRLVLPALQSVETKTLGSGKLSTKVTYADQEQCTAELWRRIDAAASVEEGLEVLAEALVAAELADDLQLPQSKRICWTPPIGAQKR